MTINKNHCIVFYCKRKYSRSWYCSSTFRKSQNFEIPYSRGSTCSWWFYVFGPGSTSQVVVSDDLIKMCLSWSYLMVNVSEHCCGYDQLSRLNLPELKNSKKNLKFKWVDSLQAVAPLSLRFNCLFAYFRTLVKWCYLNYVSYNCNLSNTFSWFT